MAHRRRTPDELVDAMNAAIQFPGLTNAWTMPIKTRTDMLATGIKTPVGIKVAGRIWPSWSASASEIEAVVAGAWTRLASLPSASWAATTSSSTSTATRSPATG